MYGLGLIALVKKTFWYHWIYGAFWSFTNHLILINVLYISPSVPVPVRTPELSLTSRSPTDILVSWQPLPAKLSRGRVSAYRLSFRTGADEQVSSVELHGNSTQYLLQDLQPDTIYLLRIEVSTRVGRSQPSAWSSHRTPKTSKATGKGGRKLSYCWHQGQVRYKPVFLEDQKCLPGKKAA